jgi:glycosyltransferase involved in cell wall biosynthesis
METLIKEKFMIRQPVFSVIIPTYNRAARIKIALESLSRQTFADFEVIISDDGSTDNTKEIVDAFRNKLDIK